MSRIFTRNTFKRPSRKPIGEYFKQNANAYGPRWEAYKRENPLRYEVCKNCGSRDQLHRHHLISPIKWPDGVDRRHNIVVLCRKCHNDTHGRKF